MHTHTQTHTYLTPLHIHLRIYIFTYLPNYILTTHTYFHIQCIVKFMSDRTRVLVTNQLNVLKRCDWIVVLDAEKVSVLWSGMFRYGLKKNP